MVSTITTPTTSVVDRAYSGFDSALPAVPTSIVPSGKLLSNPTVINKIGENSLPHHIIHEVADAMRGAGGFIGHNLLANYTGALVGAMARSDHRYAPLARVVEDQLLLAEQFDNNTMPTLSPLLRTLGTEDSPTEGRILGVPKLELVEGGEALPDPLREYMAA